MAKTRKIKDEQKIYLLTDKDEWIGPYPLSAFLITKKPHARKKKKSAGNDK